MKKNKKVLTAVLVTLLSVGALSAVAMITNAETGWVNDLMRNDETTSGASMYVLGQSLEACTFEEEKVIKSDLTPAEENQMVFPFEKVEYKFTTYASDDEVGSITLDESTGVAICSYVEEVTITYTLADDYEDFNLGTIMLMQFGFTDSDDEEKLEYELRVDGKRFSSIDYSLNPIFYSEVNPVCGDLEIIIKNPYANAEDVEAHQFTLGALIINPTDMAEV